MQAALPTFWHWRSHPMAVFCSSMIRTGRHSRSLSQPDFKPLSRGVRAMDFFNSPQQRSAPYCRRYSVIGEISPADM